MAHTAAPVQEWLPYEEKLAGRPMDIVHTYHVNDQLFPTSAERSVALAPGRNRLLLINWKPATDMSWAAVAQGEADARIDRLAKYIDSTFPYRFFLTIWHEPENDVVPSAGSGMTASDYAAMYRHVVLRLRADGVTNAVTVMNYMGYVPWALKSWFNQLWPGGDVVDWIGFDPYAFGTNAGDGYDFSDLVNQSSGDFPGYYSWAVQNHPGKPIMIAEWGVRYAKSNPDGQANFFRSVAAELPDFPAIHALSYYDWENPPRALWRTDLAATNSGLAAYRHLGKRPGIVAPAYSHR